MLQANKPQGRAKSKISTQTRETFLQHAASSSSCSGNFDVLALRLSPLVETMRAGSLLAKTTEDKRVGILFRNGYTLRRRACNLCFPRSSH